MYSLDNFLPLRVKQLSFVRQKRRKYTYSRPDKLIAALSIARPIYGMSGVGLVGLIPNVQTDLGGDTISIRRGRGRPGSMGADASAARRLSIFLMDEFIPILNCVCLSSSASVVQVPNRWGASMDGLVWSSANFYTVHLALNILG